MYYLLKLSSIGQANLSCIRTGVYLTCMVGHARLFAALVATQLGIFYTPDVSKLKTHFDHLRSIKPWYFLLTD